MLRLRLLGSFELRGPGDRPLKITARKTRALLAFLALQNGTRQSRERLAALLWEDADAELARSSLRQALTALRRALPAKLHALLDADAQQVALNLAQVQVDVHSLRTLLTEATAPSLKAARALGAQTLLEGFDAHSGAFEEWVAAERRSLRRDLAAAATRLAALCRDANDTEGEVDALNWLLAIEPLQEGAHRELMGCYARSGRYTEALRQYQLCRTVLRRELDLAPDPATEALYRELMKKRRAGASGPLHALPAAEPDDAADVDLASEVPQAATTDDRVLHTGVVLALRLPGLAAERRTLDPEEAREKARKLQLLFDETVALHGGVADRLSGDRLNAVFGLENLSGNEPQRALRAAQSLMQAFGASELTSGAPAAGVAQGALLPTRINGPFPLSGDPMSDAEALAGRAHPGEIQLSEGLRRALGVRHLPFAGRHAELTLMTSLLERSIATRRGRTIVVRGDAGIGKTRLLEAFADAARALGTECHRVQVLDFGQVRARRPLAALVSSLLGLGPEAGAAERGLAIAQAIESGRLPADGILHASGLVGAPLSADQVSIERNLDAQALDQGRMEVVRRLIETACAKAPLVLVIEDLHYAGGEEAARLGELAAVVASQPALLVLSTRPDEDPIDAAWRARARGCPLTTLDLAPLTEDESRELAASHPALPEWMIDGCIRRAQGHPLFLDQLLRAADAGETAMPASVQALVLSRVEKLEREDRQALLAASVLGLRFPREALAAMLDGPSGTPDRLVDAGLLTVEGGEIAFAHALMREAVYGSLLKSRRRELHARAAAWYAGHDAGLRAGHLTEAGDPAAARACIEAAVIEADSLRLDRAVEFSQKACMLAREPVDLCLARCLLGELQTRTGHTHDAIATLREVIDLRPDALMEARARLALANALRILDRYDEALETLERAEAVLAGHERPELLARIWSLRGNIRFPRGEIEECLVAHENALSWARRAGSPVDEARAFGGIADALFQRGRVKSARNQFEKCVVEARLHGAIGLALSNAPMLAITRGYCGEVRQGLADCAETATEAARFGDPRSEVLARLLEATLSTYCADFDRTRLTSDRGLAIARRLGARRFEAELMAHQGHAIGELGGVADAQVLLQRATSLALEVARTYCAPWCLGALALHTPNVERAHELLAQGEALLAAGCVSHNHFEYRRVAIEFWLRHDNMREVRRHAAALHDYTKDEPFAWSDALIGRAEYLADRAENPARPDLGARREALLRGIDAADFAWLRRDL
ncbi:MAG TPA: BTAD domain-containing putative transcriptional regulator [Steroidobacteraceae bacterium]|jgi:DNA-binding SARP family transcriptional activator/tetratricopeptide (TPR) repeat protein